MDKTYEELLEENRRLAEENQRLNDEYDKLGQMYDDLSLSYEDALMMYDRAKESQNPSTSTCMPPSPRQRKWAATSTISS